MSNIPVQNGVSHDESFAIDHESSIKVRRWGSVKKWEIGWGPISACNMRCQFCYSRGERLTRGDLCLSDWKRFVSQNAERIHTINYGTGENTLSFDWFQLVRFIREEYPEIRQALTTNGYLSEAVRNPECLWIFRNCIDEVDVSLDFCDRDRHTAFRGQEKAYDWAISTLELCATYQKPTTIVFLGSKVNVSRENIDGLFALAKTHHAILRMNMYRPTAGINAFSQNFIIPYKTVEDILRHIAEKYHIIALNDTLFSAIFTGRAIEDPSGKKSVRILSDGSITPSTYLIRENYVVGNILNPNALKDLDERDVLTRLIYRFIPDDCRKCVYCNQCAGGVYDRRYLWFHTLQAKDPYCQGPYQRELPNPIPVTQTAFHTVHDGYLPTIFFSP